MEFIFSLIISVFLTSPGSLLDSYSNKIEKSIEKRLKVSSYDLNPFNYDVPFTEVYRISENKKHIGILFIKSVRSCNIGGCTTSKSSSLNASEYFDVMIITDYDLEIKEIKVLNYFSDYGYEITSKRFLKKFSEQSICNLKSGSFKVDAISGATVSHNALINTINELCSLKNVLLKA